MTVANEIKGLTSDPGARKLGEYLDGVLNRVSVLETKVAACCEGGGEIARPAAPTEPSATPPTS